jgi:hypothetical protein
MLSWVLAVLAIIAGLGMGWLIIRGAHAVYCTGVDNRDMRPPRWWSLTGKALWLIGGLMMVVAFKIVPVWWRGLERCLDTSAHVPGRALPSPACQRVVTALRIRSQTRVLKLPVTNDLKGGWSLTHVSAMSLAILSMHRERHVAD